MLVVINICFGNFWVNLFERIMLIFNIVLYGVLLVRDEMDLCNEKLLCCCLNMKEICEKVDGDGELKVVI